MSTPLTRPASVARWHDEPPHAGTTDARTWIGRGANFVVAVTQAEPGMRLARHAQPDEYMVYLPECGATLRAGGESVEAAAQSVTIVPPGDSEVLVQGHGQVVRVFSHQAQDLLALASNAQAYATAPADVAPLVPWPTPADGFRLRSYALADHTQADSNMRIFRSTNLMLNVLTPRMVPRDVHKLSPHSHADFEQGSLALRGEWIHHMRYPWGPDMAAWRDDEGIEVGSPSLTVIPPKVVHTSRNLNAGGAWLLDIFAPPRMDFSSKPGKVANEADYPLPAP
jgi:mannose-6-phosphate isomerase-like protein (cupin superfamily)